MATKQRKPAAKGKATNRKQPVIKETPPPVVPTPELTLAPDALEAVRGLYESYLDDEMGNLHNQFVAFISESKLPLPQVLIVLKILEAETIEIARHKYMGA